MGGKRITHAVKTRIGRWNAIPTNRERSHVPRQCDNCGIIFIVPLQKMGRDRKGKVIYVLSQRRSCSAVCAKGLHASALSKRHDAARAADPEGYAAWLAAVRSHYKIRIRNGQPPTSIPRSPIRSEARDGNNS